MAVIANPSTLPAAQQAAITRIQALRPEARQGVTIETTSGLEEGTIVVTTKPGGRKHFVNVDGRASSGV